MSRELAQTLIKQGLVNTAAVEEALQRQVVFGGSLDTNLLEAGAATEDTLLEALSLTFNVPQATRAQIDQVGAHMPRLFPLVFAETYHLVPYRLVEQDFWVLLNGAPDEQLFARIHERLHLKLMPAVTTEARLHYAMHRLYGTTLLPRFQNLLQKLDGEAPKVGKETASAGDHVLSWGLSSAPINPTRARGDKKRAGLDVRGLLSRLEAATDRDSIVEILLGATLSIFDFAGLFLVQGDNVNGWRGTTPEATQKIVRVTLPVEQPSVFQTIYATHGHYLGPLPQNTVNTKLLADMDRKPPRTALLAPMLVGGKLAAILYADNGAEGVPSKRVAAVLLLAQRAGMCLEALIRRSKTSAQEIIADKVAIARGPSDEHRQVTEATHPGEPWVVNDDAIELVPQEAAAPASELPEAPEKSDEAWDTVALDDVPQGAMAPDDGTPPNMMALNEAAPPPTAMSASMSGEVELDADSVLADDYEAFADVDETPNAALDDWEDVLVEASGLESKSPAESKRKSAPPSVTWEDVIVEAERSSRLLMQNRSEAVQVLGQVVDERELLFDTLEAQDPEARRGAVERLLAMGSAIDDAVTARFPGVIEGNLLTLDTRLPPFRRLNGLCEYLFARGQGAAALVLPHLESEDPQKRLVAIYYLHSVAYPPALGALARRLYDTEPRNRYLAADALRTYTREPGYAHIVQGLRDQLKVPILETQISTVQVLGQLRDPSSVPSLIPMVIAPRPELARAAASALAVICAQALGPDVTRWAEWWQSHFNRPRPAWLLESLRSSNPAIVHIAHTELVLLSGRSVPLDPEAPAEEREAAVRAWEQWWREVQQPRAQVAVAAPV